MEKKQNWSNRIYDQILKYKGQWIFYSYKTDSIISHNKTLAKAREEALKKENQDNIVSLFVKEEWGEKYLLPIYNIALTLLTRVTNQLFEPRQKVHCKHLMRNDYVAHNMYFQWLTLCTSRCMPLNQTQTGRSHSSIIHLLHRQWMNKLACIKGGIDWYVAS
ncbi:MAG: hypothetical protein MUC29_08585 [Pyrinomonadaceae bacterium]|nr:hypothetical protein [Pyrinomonadaceae bacterium]